MPQIAPLLPEAIHKDTAELYRLLGTSAIALQVCL